MNKYLDTSLVDKAVKFAVDAHANTERRGKGFPYVIHVFEAMEIAATITNDPVILAATALHDTVEDTDVTLDDIRREFGDRVASLVDAETDKPLPGENESTSWRARKQAAIDRLASAPREAKIVAMGDKLSNMRAIARDYDKKGNRLWDLFHAPGGRTDHEWHYRGLADSLSELEGTVAYAEFLNAVEHVFGRPSPECVDMGEYERSGEGYTAESYFHKDGKRMLKLYSDFVPSTEAELEFDRAGQIEELGLLIPHALRMVTDGKRTGIEFERIRNKKSFARAISEEPDRLEEYSSMFAAMCRELHSKTCARGSFRPAEERFLKAVSESGFLNEEQKSEVVRFIRSIPSTDNCVHGDLHIGNALMSDGKLYWIDLAGFGYGNPLFDLGMMYFLCLCLKDEEQLLDVYHLSSEQMRRVWKTFSHEYFEGKYTEEQIDTMVAPFAALYIIYFESKGLTTKAMMEFVKAKLLNDE